MRWRDVMIGGGAALGATALFNAMATRDVPPLPNPLGGEEGSFTWRGHAIAWTRRGSGPALLLVHSIHAAAWSYEWRHVVDRLAASHTVWTLDLLGFGRSARPEVAYSPGLYVSLLDDFTQQVVGEPCVLVGSSLGGAYVVALAARDAARFPAVVLVCPVGVTHLASTPGPVNDGARAVIDAPLLGSALFNALVSKPSMRFFLEQAFATPGWVTPALLDAYWATAHQPGAKHAPAAFVGMALNLNVRDALRRLAQPLLITWGDRAKEVPRAELDAYRALKPDARVHLFAPSGSLPHDEHAAAWTEVVLGFLAGVAREEPLARSA